MVKCTLTGLLSRGKISAALVIISVIVVMILEGKSQDVVLRFI